MRFASLGSGSEGNGLIVEASGCRLLLDCGFTLKETERRLARLGLLAEDLDAVVVTHEHGDHISGALKLARRYRLPLWMSYGTALSLDELARQELSINICSAHCSFMIGALTIQPYPVPHDAREPLQYVFSHKSWRLGVLTDAGHCTVHIVEMLSGCDALVLECNHDRRMLEQSSYPYSLKQRIGGRYGHLSNEVAGEILGKLDQSRLRFVFAAHLSRQNNTADLARSALLAARHEETHEIHVADQDEGFHWVDLTQ